VPNATSRIRSIVHWIDEASGRYPDNVAAIEGEESLTFAQLSQYSTDLAHELVSRGVRTNDFVGLWAAQGCDLLIGIVGIMKSGAAYVPLDPSQPRTRLEDISSDAGLGFVVAPELLRGSASTLGVPVVLTRTHSKVESSRVGELPEVQGHDVAYVIFTSGSTGRPKGVIIEHHSVVDLLAWMIDDRGLQAGHRIMGTASPSFDASVPILLLPLVIGGTFIALSKEASVDPSLLMHAIERYHPRALDVPPTMLRMLMDAGWPGDKDLEIWTGGERVSAAAIAYIAPRVQSLCNYYGPTETTVQVTMARLGPDDTDSPIGRARDGVSCPVMDGEGHRVADGEIGELFVLGSALARGYVNDPILTAERFAPITLEDGSIERAYRTGDLAYVRADGSLALMGRIDDQINLRGYRIEPTEIERRLLQHPRIIDAAVIAYRASSSDDPRLVAFLKSRGQIPVDILRDFAKESLPDYMVPTLVISVDEFPLTANGKVDRKRLAGMVDADLLNHDARELSSEDRPTNERQNAVANMFAEVLEVASEQIALDDDFFDLGGTSMRVVRLFMLVEERFGVTLPISTVVTAPTIRLLASAIDTEVAKRTAEPQVSDSTQYTWEKIVCNLWSEILGVAEVRPSDNFFDLGGSEADAEKMIDQLKMICDTDLDLEKFRDLATARQVAAITGDRPNRSSLVPLRSVGTKTPLFCIAGAGGLALAFLPLARQLGPDQPVYGLQAHGLECRGIPDFSLRQVAARYVREIQKVQPNGPYVIAGHSLGGVIAAMVAERLKRGNETVALLAIFDTRLSGRMIGSKVADRHYSEVGPSAWRPYTVRPRFSTLIRLPFAGIVRFRGTSQYDVFYWIGVIQARSTGRLVPWSGPTIVFGSDDEESADIRSQWARLLTGSWKYLDVPDSHQNMIRHPYVKSLARNLEQEMAHALSVCENPDRGAHDPPSAG